MSSFFGTCSIFLLTEDNSWSSVIVAYRLNSLSDDGPLFVEPPKNVGAIAPDHPISGQEQMTDPRRNTMCSPSATIRLAQFPFGFAITEQHVFFPHRKGIYIARCKRTEEKSYL